MANHLKAWADDDIVLKALKFPNVPAAKRVQPTSVDDLIDGKPRQPPTGKYKFRCTTCNKYYDSNSNHKCK